MCTHVRPQHSSSHLPTHVAFGPSLSPSSCGRAPHLGAAGWGLLSFPPVAPVLAPRFGPCSPSAFQLNFDPVLTSLWVELVLGQACLAVLHRWLVTGAHGVHLSVPFWTLLPQFTPQPLLQEAVGLSSLEHREAASEAGGHVAASVQVPGVSAAVPLYPARPAGHGRGPLPALFRGWVCWEPGGPTHTCFIAHRERVGQVPRYGGWAEGRDTGVGTMRCQS